MKIKNIKEMIRQSILAEYNMNEDYDVETGNSDVGLKKLYANNVNEASLDPEDIKRKYNEMFGKNPSTKFADVAKALNRSEEEVTMALMGISLPKLEEAEEEEISDEETVDIKAPAPDVPADMPSDTTMVDEPTYTPEEAAVMSNLDNALKKSQGLNDKILSDLIGNIIIYFSRQHVVKEGEAGKKKHYKGAVKDDEDQISKLKKDMKFDKKQLKTESLEILKMKKLAGLLKEGEYAKALLNENENAIETAFNKSPKSLPWGTIEQTYQESGLSGEEFFAGAEDKFRKKFEGKPVSKKEYFEFFTNLPTAMGQDDLYTMVNWISFTDENLADKLYNTI